jgi:hypothetical protein
MEKTMDCSEFRDDMIDVLYGEAAPDVAVRFEGHTASCAACRDELASLSGVRRDLQAWSVDARPPRRAFWPGLRLPAIRNMAAAAAVVLAFGGGLAVSRTELRMRDGEVAFRFGPARDAAEVTQQLARYEQAHRAEIDALKAQLVSTQPGGAMSSFDDDLLRRVQAMIQESEARQTMLLQTSLNQLGQHTEAQRRYDLAQVAAGLSYLESKTGADVARTNKMMSDILRVSQDEQK